MATQEQAQTECEVIEYTKIDGEKLRGSIARLLSILEVAPVSPRRFTLYQELIPLAFEYTARTAETEHPQAPDTDPYVWVGRLVDERNTCRDALIARREAELAERQAELARYQAEQAAVDQQQAEEFTGETVQPSDLAA